VKEFKFMNLINKFLLEVSFIIVFCYLNYFFIINLKTGVDLFPYKPFIVQGKHIVFLKVLCACLYLFKGKLVHSHKDTLQGTTLCLFACIYVKYMRKCVHSFPYFAFSNFPSFNFEIFYSCYYEEI
jgi:hypothetical protein